MLVLLGGLRFGVPSVVALAVVMSAAGDAWKSARWSLGLHDLAAGSRTGSPQRPEVAKKMGTAAEKCSAGRAGRSGAHATYLRHILAA
jgi:hypothetical protein